MPKIELDAYEQEIEDAFNEENMVSVPNVEERIKEAQQMARNTLKKKKSITLRVLESDIMRIKRMAANEGMPYQTMIASVLHQFATRGEHKPPEWD